MMEEPTDLDAQLAARVRSLRADRGLSLDALAETSGVSRSMISLIERGRSSPTAKVLDRLAAALGVSLGSLFESGSAEPVSPVSRRGDQAVWRDPETGYLRRNLSPAGAGSAIELVEVALPAGARVALDSPTRSPALDQQVWVMEGTVVLTLGEETHQLAAGDCMAMRVDRPTAFRNPAGEAARYLVAITLDARR